MTPHTFGRIRTAPRWLAFAVTALLLGACANQAPAPQFDVPQLTGAVVGETYAFDLKVQHERLDEVTLTLVLGPDWLQLEEGAAGAAQLFGTPPRNAEGSVDVHVLALHAPSGARSTLYRTLDVAPARARLVSAGVDHSLMITTVGEVYTWGNNEAGQLGYVADRSTVPRKVTALDGVTALTGVAGDSVSMIVDDQGRVWAWGVNVQGQLGVGSAELIVPTPTQVQGALVGIPVAQVALGAMHTLALTRDGSLYVWGGNNLGQLGKGDRLPIVEPRLIGIEAFDGRTLRAIAAGENHSIALTDNGAIYVWGDNTGQTLGIGSEPLPRVLSPRTVGVVSGVAEFVEVRAHGYESFAVALTGRAYGWGANARRALGTMEGPITRPAALDFLEPGDVRTVDVVAPGNGFTALLMDDDELLIQGGNEFTMSAGTATSRVGVVRIDTFPRLDGVVVAPRSVSGGDEHVLVIDTAGRVFAWGRNPDGRLGNGRTVDAFVPQLVYP